MDVRVWALYLGVVIIVIVICVALLIFAPKNNNFFDDSIIPQISQTFDKQTIKHLKNETTNSTLWVDYIPNKMSSGTMKILPIWMNSKMNSQSDKISYTLGVLNNVPYIQSAFYLHLDAESATRTLPGWKEMCNDTLRCCVCIYAPESSTPIDKYCIWVDGDSKKLKTKNIILFDASKKHSIQNLSDEPATILMIDIKRPKHIPAGTSKVSYDKEILEFMQSI